MMQVFGIPYLKKGKGIHIKKKNRGKFTEYCGGKVTNECIQKAKNSKNPKLRKRATFAANARKWKHQTGGMLSLIPKGQSGWTAYLNPKNWGVKDYVADNFSLAFNQAEADGQKEFLWRGNRYAVKRADLTEFNKQLEWFKNYINNYKLEDVQLNNSDSINAQTLGVKELRSNYNKVDSIRGEVINSYSPKAWENYIQLRDSLSNIDSINKKFYELVRKDKLKKVKDKANNIRQERFILTTQPNRKWNTRGWYMPKVDSLYASNDPGTFVHELSHATGADLLKNLRPTKEAVKQDAIENLDADFAWYLQNPLEMGARYIQNQFLKEKGLPTSTYHVDKEHNLIQME